MAKINPRLKSVFTSYNLLFSIVGVLLLVLGMWNDTWRHKDSELVREVCLLFLYMMGTLTLTFSLLGAYGAHNENKVALVMFLVCMITGSIVTLSTGVSAAVARPQIVEQMKDVLKISGPNKDFVYSVQKTLHCCGLFSYKDWGNQIPDSCLCKAQEMEGRLCTTATSYGQKTKTIYPQPCFPILESYLNVFVDYILGVSFTLAIMAVLGVVLSSAMIHQMRDVTKPTKVPTKVPILVLKVPAVFTPKLPKYQELFNTP